MIMTAIVPTATSIKLKFPEFSGLADGTVEFAIEEALMYVTDASGWVTETDQTMASMYLTAHHLMVTLSRAQSGTGQRIKSETMGGMSITYDTDATTPESGDYTTTPYGKRFLELVQQNFPAIGIV
jgi:hypothetical protein